MKRFICSLTALMFSSPALADQAATITCTGNKVIFQERSPYLGENSRFTQQLFILKAADSEGESEYAAYFLDVSVDVGGSRNIGAGVMQVSGKNKAGGKFVLSISPFKDNSDGTTVREVAQGRITYSHGPLRGREEVVSCVME